MAKQNTITAVVTLRKRKALLVGCAGIAMSFYSGSAQANPEGPDIVGGSIGISGLGTSQVDIVQSTSRGAINWNSFSIGNGETTRFVMPDSNSITLNRVTGADPSHILGTMTSNGKIILINGNGILFGPDSKVDAAGLIASTHDVDTDAFMTGAPLRFFTGVNERPNASVVNEGQITIHDAGVAGFVAPSVRNSGLIQADAGQVVLGAGKGFTLDLYGDDLISFEVNDHISSTLTAADGTPLRALVENDGLIKAAGGKIILTAATAREVVNQAVHVTGTVTADSVTQKGGDIILGGGANGIVNVSNAKISAKGKTGGSIKVTGDQIAVSHSTLDVSGENGGGVIRVGGGYQGGEGLQHARTVSLDADSRAVADATLDGNGGNVVLWSDNGTDFAGTISARGEAGGHGGDAEVSSAGLLSYHGVVDLRATSGETGTLLLDPENITVSNGATTLLTCTAGACTATGDSSVLNITDLLNALNSSNVTVSTGTVGSQAGTITVANNISWGNSNLLTLSAASSIIINSGVTITNTYNGSYAAGRIPVVLALRADNAGVNNNSTITNNGTINMAGSSGAVAMYYDNGAAYTAGTQTANASWAAPTDGSVSSQFTAYRLVNTVADLAAINSNLGFTYALGKNIVGSGAFNSNAPMGVFTGILDGGYGKLAGGSNYTITGLTLGPATNTTNVGLFGTNSGILRNFGLGLAVTATGSSTTQSYNGTLAGINNGTIANIASTGALTYTYTGSGSTGNTTNLGGLVGQNNTTGTIINSTNSGAVTLNQNGTFTSTATVNVGGLAGRNDSTIATSISGSGASGNVTARYGTGTAKTTANIGGLLGFAGTATTINASTYSTGTVTSSLQNGVLNIGGLVGNGSIIGANILGSTTSGAVSFTGAGSSAANIGGLAGTSLGTITSSNSSASESYTGSGSGAITMGGLAGTSNGSISSSGATGDVSFGGTGSSAGTLGGLVGVSTASITSSTATGPVTFNGSSNGAMILGGLAGSNSSTIITSNSTSGAVAYTGSGTGGGTIGGLVGSNLATGTITNSYSTSAANFATTGTSGIGNIGGLVGNNAGAIEGTGVLYSYSTGTPSLGSAVVSGSVIGGLVGTNSGSIKQAYSTGATINITLPAAVNVGGLVGANTGVVGDSAALSATTYSNNVVIVSNTPTGTSAPTDNIGGLIGLNSGTATVYNTAATGNVTYNYKGTSTGNMKAYVGGLIGTNSSTALTSVTNSSYAGDVVAQYEPGYSASGGVTQAVGGLVGYMTGASEILNSVSSGTASDNLDGKSAAEYVGGLVGYMNVVGGTVTNSHSSTAISYTGTGSPSVGGLIGFNKGIIQGGSYATGTITVGSTATSNVYIGGLVGQQAAGSFILNSYSDNGTITYTDNLTAYLGGLVGKNDGTIGDVNALSATTYSNTNVVMNANPSGTTANTYSIGNLAGSNSGIIVNTKTGGDATFNYAGTTTSGTTTVQLGGLVGVNTSTSATSITNSTASNTVTAKVDATATGAKIITAYIGGIEGYSTGGGGIIDNVSSSATINSGVSNGTIYVGGLAGYIGAATGGITNSFATGTVNHTGTTASSIGGLVGYNKGIIQGSGVGKYAYAQNTVNVSAISTGTTNIGGLAGLNNGTIKQAYSDNGTISYTGGGTINIGGLVGQSTAGTIGDSAASSATTYSNSAVTLNAAPTATATYTAGNLVGLLTGTAASVINVKTGADVSFYYAGTGGTNIAYIGGLIGQNSSTLATSASFAVATNNVLANYTPGFSGAVTLGAGGFAGYLTGATIMTGISSTGTVSSDLAGTLISMGGLVGTTAVAGSTITNSFATGNVTYSGIGATAVNVGGLVGKNQGIIQGSGVGSYSYATGDVKVTGVTNNASTTVNVGGLAGTSNLTISQAYSQDGVVEYTGAASIVNAGGLVGQITAGTVGNASATTPTTYSNENVTTTIKPTGTAATTVSVGGLVGSIGTVATGNIVYAKATGDVSYIYQGTSSAASNAYLGGILGSQTNTLATSLSNSYSMGAVSAAYAAGYNGTINVAAGGAVGYVNSLTARQGIWTSSSVTDSLNTGTQYLGGLIGANNSTGATSNSYSIGTVSYTGSSAVAEGGLIGYNKGNVNQSYTTSNVMNTGAGVGGLIGSNVSGTVTDGYWDTGTTGQATSAAGTGVTTVTLQSALQGAFSTSTWGIVAGETNPYLKWQFATGTPQSISGNAYSDLGVTAISNASVGAVSNGSLVSSVLTKDGYAVTGANGYYYFLVAPTTLATSNGKILTYLTGATKANTVIDTANKASGSAMGLDLYATYLHEYSASTTISGMMSGLGTALGGNTGANFLYTFAAGAPTLKAGTNVAVDGTGASLSINQNLNASGGSVYVRNNGAVTQTTAITATKLILGGTGAYTLTNASNAIGKLAGNAASINLKDSTALTVDTVDGIAGITTTGATQIVSGGGITLNQGITAGGTGTSILLAGTQFTNNAGASALTTGAGKFQVWSANPSGDTRGGLTYDYKQYNATYVATTVLGTGNGFLYSAAPILSAGLSGIAKVYDGSTTASITGATQNVTGAIDGDTVVLSLSGATGTYSDKNVATGKAVTVSGVTVTSTTNGSATVYGYQLNQPTGVAGDITKAALSITGATANNKVYDSTSAATLGGTAVLSGKVSGDTVTLGTGSATGTFADKNAGTGKTVTASGYSISGADAGNYTLTQPTGLTANISAAALTLSGLSASNKVYDATTTATLTGTAALSGKFAGDTVAVSGAGVGTFADKNVASGKAVTVTGYSISGADAGNYIFTQPAGLTANISKATLNVSGLSASGKVYDSTTIASLTGTAALSGLLGSDSVSIGGTGAGSFADKNVGTSKTVTASGYTISGTDAGNYNLVQQSGLTANITAATLNVTGLSGVSRAYDATTAATLTGTAALSGKYAGDSVTMGGTASATFADKNVANGKAIAVSGYTIGGADATNYILAQPTGITANITQATLTLSGLSATNKIYNATTAATLTGTASLSGKLGSDAVSFSGTGVGTFSDKNVANGKTVTVTGYSISGIDAANYAFAQPVGLTANITPASLTVSGITASNKIYDALTTATVTGTAALSGKLGSDVVTLGGTGAGTFADKNVANGKAVTVTGYSVSGTDAGNYTFVQPTGLTANITPAALTLSGLSASNKIYDATTAATLTGTAALSGKLGSDVVTIGGTGAGTFANKNVANGKAVSVTGYTVSGADAGNYTFTQPTGLTANITPAALTLSGLGASNKVYDATTTATLTGTAALSGKIGSDVVTFSGTGAGAFADKNVANGKTVSVSGYSISGTDAGNYTFTQPSGLTANITPASLTITGLSASNKVYDTLTTATLTGTAALSGKLGSDAVAIGGAGAGAFSDKNVANGKAVTVTGYTVSGADAGNYTFIQPTGLTANITPAALTLGGLSALNKVYDTTTAATLTGTATLSGKLGSDSVSIGGTGSGVFADKNVANGKAVTVTGYSIGGADAGNYAFVQPTGLTANITPAALTLSGLGALNKVYDATTAASLTGTATLSGKLGSDVVTIGGTGAAAFGDKNVANGKAVTVSGYTIGGTDALNYSFTQPTGLIANITPASLTLSGLSASNKVYDATTAATLTGTAALSGKLGSDVVTFGGTGVGLFSDKNVANGKAVSVTGYSIAGTDAANYAFVQPTGLTANITPATIGVSGLSGVDKVYDTLNTATLSGTAVLSGRLGSDIVTLNGTGTGTFADKNAANGKTITVTGYSVSGADAGNYTIVQPTGLTANITHAALTLSGLNATSKIYDATTAATLTGTAALSGKLGSDAVTFSGTGIGTFNDKNVANGKAVAVTGYSIAGTDAGNYIFTQPTGLTANITPAALSITGLNGVSKVYDANTVAGLGGTAALSGRLGSDTVTLGGTGTGTFADKNAGTGKSITVTGYNVSGSDAANYTLIQPTGLNANITQAALGITGLTGVDKIYDALTVAGLSGTATLSGLISGDTVALDGTGTGAFVNKNVGSNKAITVSGYSISGTDATNYNFVQPTGLTGNITPASLSISGLGANDKVYDSTTTATLNGTALLLGRMSGDSLTLGGTVSSVFTDKNVGSNKAVTISGYTIDGIDAGNYTLAQPASVTANITAATLSINGVGVNTKVYDATTQATLSGTAALQGLFSGDLINLATGGATASFADKNVASGKAVNVSGYAISGTDAGNYNLAQPTGVTGNITPAGLTVGGISAVNKVYDATTAAALNGTAALSGLLGSDAVTLGGTALASFGDKNVASGKAVTVIGYNITGGDAGNYNFTQPVGLTASITPATLGIAGVSAGNKVYDGGTAATLQVSGTALTGKFAGDAVTLVTGSVTGAFSDKNAGTGKTVLISGFGIAGTDASNYTLLPAGSVTANITPKALGLTGSFTADSKIYDGTPDVAIAHNLLALSGVVGSDSVTLDPVAAFADAAIGNNKIVSISALSVLGGSGGGNYTLLLAGSPTALANIISAKPAIGPEVTRTTTALFSAQPAFAVTTASSTTTINTLASVSGNNPSEKIMILPANQVSTATATTTSAPAEKQTQNSEQEGGCEDGGSNGSGSCN